MGIYYLPSFHFHHLVVKGRRRKKYQIDLSGRGKRLAKVELGQSY